MGDTKLTDRFIADIVLPEATKDVLQFDAELKGFGVRVTKRGARIFLYQYRLGPKVRRIAIGEWPTTTAARARKLAETLRGAVKGGADPVADTKAKRSATLHAEQEARRTRAIRAFTVGKLIDDGNSTGQQKIFLSNRCPEAIACGVHGLGRSPRH